MKRFVTLMLLSAFVVGSAMADTKATKSAKNTEKSKYECCVEHEGCCKAMKSEKTSKSSKEEKQQEKKESETPESK